MEPKEIPSHLILRLFVVFTRQLEILVTTLSVIKSLNCNETMVARLVSEGGRGEGGVIGKM